MSATLFESIINSDNDYRCVEDDYYEASGGNLVSSPEEVFASLPVEPKTVSIIIPSWKAGATLTRCLLALSHSEYIILHPGRVQVVIVDDGCEEDIVPLICRHEYPFEVLVVRQPHFGRAHAMNVGLAWSEGEVLISCDADMLLAPWAISEAVRRISVCPSGIFVGFRRDVSPHDMSVTEDALLREIPPECFEFWGDNRFTYHWDGHVYPGWPSNMFLESSAFKSLGFGRIVNLADGDIWSLPRMVYGALFAFHRVTLEIVGGFDERFKGWGYEDTFFAAKAVAAQSWIVPVPSMCGIHLSHPIRSPRQWEEGRRNGRLYGQLLKECRLGELTHYWREPAQNRSKLVRRIRSTDGAARFHTTTAIQIRKKLEDPLIKLPYLAALGAWPEAREVARELPEYVPLVVASIAASVLRQCGDVEGLNARKNLCTGRGCPFGVQLAMFLCSQGRISDGIDVFKEVVEIAPKDPTVAYILKRGATKHLRRARLAESNGFDRVAADDRIAALLQPQKGG
jgi:glycosyltransferase involved in cell wall biosynthesis